MCAIKSVLTSSPVFSLPPSEGRGPLLRIQWSDLSKRRELQSWLQTPMHLHRWSSRVRASLPQPRALGVTFLPCPAAGQGARAVLPQHRLPQGNHGRAPGVSPTPASRFPSVPSIHSLPSVSLPKAFPEALPEVLHLQTQKGEGYPWQRTGGSGTQVGQATWKQAPGR